MNKNKTIIKYLKESQGLNAKEMLKYPARIKTFVDKVTNGDPFTLTDNSQVQLAFDQEHLQAFIDDPESYIKQNPLYTQDGRKLAWGKLAKTKEFGGGFGEQKAGSGAGAAETKKAESATAVACAIAALNGGKITMDMLTPENIKRASAGFKVDSPTEDILQKFAEPEWADTFVKTANKFFEKMSNVNDMIFYRGQGPVNQISAAFKKANANEDKYYSSQDKWNPSDIWAITPGATLPSKDDAEDLMSLKAFMQSAFDKGEIIGISLKKLGAEANFEIVNKGEGPNELLNKKLDSLILNKKDVLFGSKDAYMTYESVQPQGSFLKSILQEKGEIQFRTFGSGDTDAIQGEVKGATASHGKIGLGNINKMLKDLGLREVTSNSEVKQILKSEGREGMALRIFQMANKVKSNVGGGALNQEQLEDFIAANEDAKPNWFISKYQSVELLYIISAVNDSKIRDKFISKIVSYAKSQSDKSSVFVKIF